VELGLSGIEALSGIPGTAGAAPVQNIGAYGAEIRDTLENVSAYDTQEMRWVEFNNADCRFSYRDSVFKQNPGRWIIAGLTLRLSKRPPQIPDYKDVLNYFAARQTAPSLQDIRQAILEIRAGKLPDPKIIPNCGSFFKNP